MSLDFLVRQFTKDYNKIQDTYFIYYSSDYTKAQKFCEKYKQLFIHFKYSYLKVVENEIHLDQLFRISVKTKNIIHSVPIIKSQFIPNLQILVEEDEDGN